MENPAAPAEGLPIGVAFIPSPAKVKEKKSPLISPRENEGAEHLQKRGGSNKEKKRSRREKRDARRLATSESGLSQGEESEWRKASEESHISRRGSRDSRIYEVTRKNKPRRSSGTSQVLDAAFFTSGGRDVHGTTLVHDCLTSSGRAEVFEENEIADLVVGAPTGIPSRSSNRRRSEGSVLQRLIDSNEDGVDGLNDGGSVKDMLKNARRERAANRREERGVMEEMEEFTASIAAEPHLPQEKKKKGWRKLKSTATKVKHKESKQSPRSREFANARKGSTAVDKQAKRAQLSELLVKRPSQEELERRGILRDSRRESSKKLSAKKLENFLSTRPHRGELVSKQVLKFDLFDQPLEKIALFGTMEETVRELELGPLDVVLDYLQAHVGKKELLLIDDGALDNSDSMLAVVEVKNTLEKAAAAFQEPVLTDAPSRAIALFFFELLRQMAEPVIPFRLYTRVMATARIEATDIRVGELHTLLWCLPPLHRRLLRRTCAMLAAAADPNKKNGMNAANLARVFGPALLRPLGALSPRKRSDGDSLKISAPDPSTFHHKAGLTSQSAGSIVIPPPPRESSRDMKAASIVETMILEYNLLFERMDQEVVFELKRGAPRVVEATLPGLVRMLLDTHYTELDPLFPDMVFLTHSYYFGAGEGPEGASPAEKLLGALVRRFTKLNKHRTIRTKTWQHPIRLRILSLLLHWVRSNEVYLGEQGDFMPQLLEFSRPLPQLGGQASLIPEEAEIFRQLNKLCGRDGRSQSIHTKAAMLNRSTMLNRLRLGSVSSSSVVKTHPHLDTKECTVGDGEAAAAPPSMCTSATVDDDRGVSLGRSVVTGEAREGNEGAASEKLAGESRVRRHPLVSAIRTEGVRLSNDALAAALAKYGGDDGPNSPPISPHTASLVSRTYVISDAAPSLGFLDPLKVRATFAPNSPYAAPNGRNGHTTDLHQTPRQSPTSPASSCQR